MNVPWYLRITAPLLLVGALLTFGCETQSPYAECELDEEVANKGICTGGGNVAQAPPAAWFANILTAPSRSA